MSGVTYLLDFNLIVETVNGTIIKQTPDDKSRFNNGSFYGDIKNLPLRRASLVGKGHIFTVDLFDGHVEANGHPIYPPKAPPMNKLLNLIYYRQVQQRLIVGENGKQLGPVVRYFIGWQCNHGGKNIKWEMGVD
jgi:hypothetical protein